MSTFDTHRFTDDGRFPNSPLPLLIHRAALPANPIVMGQHFAAQGWSNAWRDGIYTYHHFHSTAHEVLGIAAGEVRVIFGGPSGREVTVRAGDVVVIPAGIAHSNLGQSHDLLIIGAYPGGAGYDLLRGDPGEHAAALRAIAAVPRPSSDPVLGPGQGVCQLWRQPALPEHSVGASLLHT